MKLQALAVAGALVFTTQYSFAITTDFKTALKKSYNEALKQEAYPISKETLKNLMINEKADLVIIDIRDYAKIEKGIIKYYTFAMSENRHTRKEFFKKIGIYRNKSKVIIVCDTGTRGALLADELQKGYPSKQIFFLKGGFNTFYKAYPELTYVPERDSVFSFLDIWSNNNEDPNDPKFDD